MKTIYLDVYFLINLSVDLLALGIALYLTKIKATKKRLLLSGSVGALYAVVAVFLENFKYLVPIVSLGLFFIMILIATPSVSNKRRFKFSVAFLCAEMLIGGLVYYGFLFLDKIFYGMNLEGAGAENRNLLTWSIIVLLSYGTVKLLIYLFGNAASERIVKLCVGFHGRESSFEALIDTGNLVEDPGGRRPVVFITEELAVKILGEKVDFSGNLDFLPINIKKRLRLIPVKKGGETKILFGFLSDYVTVVLNNKYENVNVSFAVDKKGDLYGGYPALMPAQAIDNVF